MHIGWPIFGTLEKFNIILANLIQHFCRQKNNEGDYLITRGQFDVVTLIRCIYGTVVCLVVRGMWWVVKLTVIFKNASYYK